MDGRVAACFLVFLALLLPDDVACRAGPELPDYLYAWKFEKEINGLCRFDYFKVSHAHGVVNKEPLRNYIPIASFPSNCYDGHLNMGLNIMQTAEGNYVFAACFFFADQNQRFVCQYLHKDHGFVNFVDAKCNDEVLARPTEKWYFVLAAFLTEKEERDNGYAFVDYSANGHCCFVHYDKQVEMATYWDDVETNDGYDAEERLHFTTNRKYDTFAGIGFFHDEPSGLLEATRSEDLDFSGIFLYFGKDFDFYHVGNDKIQVPDQTAVSFLGFRYSVEGGQCAVVMEKDGTKFNQEMKMDCLDNLIGEGYNVEWNMAEQTAYLKGCFVTLHPELGPRVVCLDYYYRRGCRYRLKKSKVVNVIVGTGPEKFVTVETPDRICTLKISAYGKPAEEIVRRPEYSFGYDPYNEKMIDRRTVEAINGKAIDAPNTAGLHSIGNHLLVRVDDSKWLVVKNGKTETKYWNYAYVMEEAAARSFL